MSTKAKRECLGAIFRATWELIQAIRPRCWVVENVHGASRGIRVLPYKERLLSDKWLTRAELSAFIARIDSAYNSRQGAGARRPYVLDYWMGLADGSGSSTTRWAADSAGPS